MARVGVGCHLCKRDAIKINVRNPTTCLSSLFLSLLFGLNTTWIMFTCQGGKGFYSRLGLNLTEQIFIPSDSMSVFTWVADSECSDDSQSIKSCKLITWTQNNNIKNIIGSVPSLISVSKHI